MPRSSRNFTSRREWDFISEASSSTYSLWPSGNNPIDTTHGPVTANSSSDESPVEFGG
jgi:hypothetical protein